MSSSSRSGRFKKKLVSESTLSSEGPVVAAKLAPFVELYTQGTLSAPEFAAVYIITYLTTRFPFHWFGALQKEALCPTHNIQFTLGELKERGIHFEESVARRFSPEMSLGDLLSQYALRGVPQSVNRAVLEWSTGKYSLVLMSRIPTPEEVLNQQRQSKRCVTALNKESQLSKYVLGERDPLSFLMHDLIHADHFFFDNYCYQGQMGFYKALYESSQRGIFTEILSHEKFQHEFEYVIADMNAYCVHLMKCLKSAMYHYHENGGEVFERMLESWDLSYEQREAFMKLNGDKFKDPEDTLLIQGFFDHY